MKKSRSRSQSPDLSPSQTERQALVATELAGADLGDKRLARRLVAIGGKVAAKPATPFPRALATDADIEGFYRFVRNEAVTFEEILKPHVAATVGRTAGMTEALALHDTTEFRFGGEREGLGRLNRSGRGFLGHFTLAVSADGSRAPLGVLAVEPWARLEPTVTALRKKGLLSFADSHAMPNEMDRWLRGVEAAEAAVDDAVSLVHIMDSEADDYDLMASLGADRRWIIRLCYDRVLANAKPDGPRRVRELVARRKVRCKRTVHLSRRRKLPGPAPRKRLGARRERDATLSISATRATFRKPSYCSGPSTIEVNVVAVRELHPPVGEQPIEWLLLTTEPIDTDEQILKVVDYYRARWVIEEYFKALKTGCAYEKRQFESWHTLLNALGVLIPIAWSLLHLRSVAREDRSAPARIVLSALQEKVLRAAVTTPLPRKPTARDVLLAIAKLGGHLRSNGEPGWQVLGRGYQDLLMMTAGYRLAMQNM